ncbi:hypothetical protein MAR_020938 [Mya arenaria]|uniref:Uncharacterized protein n=1 Tax=Mya arenaria TaxID=6604 RepID=A0ABY7EAX4_MYAAR|nr:uncharacterized protein LOC128234354 [Mya arenaria]WAR05569.1 hypothetical protein MAR_020938 [Mya arenaria]
MASFLAISAIICVLIATVATIVAFSTPNWIEFEGNGDMLCNCHHCDCGLWLHCTGGSLTDTGNLDNCKWFFGDEFFIERSLPDWFKAVQGLMSCALASTMLALMIGLFSLCCSCRSCNPNMAAGAFANLTFLLLAISVILFGVQAHRIHFAEVLLEQGSNAPVYGWSFWVATGACLMSLLSSLLYFCVGRKEDYY